MEYHIDQVLYRDQRTIKTIAFKNQQPRPCPTCKQHRQTKAPSEGAQFLPNSHRQSDDALSIRGVPNSSLFSNCHIQYCSKLKRLLYQTEVQCGCEGLRDSVHHCEEKTVRCKSWLKKFPTVFLLGTYLYLISFPYVSAVPTTISSRPTAFWNNRNGGSDPAKSLQSKMNITALTQAYRSALSAVHRAVDLKEKFRARSDSDPEVVYKDTLAYEWLPQVPKNNSADFQDHLQSLKIEQAVLDLYTYLQTIRVPIEQLEVDFKNDTTWGRNFSSMRGALTNIVEDLYAPITENNLSVVQNVSNDIMPDSLRKLDKTNQALRDWLIIRTLVEILVYAVAVFEHFSVPL